MPGPQPFQENQLPTVEPFLRGDHFSVAPNQDAISATTKKKVMPFLRYWKVQVGHDFIEYINIVLYPLLN